MDGYMCNGTLSAALSRSKTLISGVGGRHTNEEAKWLQPLT